MNEKFLESVAHLVTHAGLEKSTHARKSKDKDTAIALSVAGGAVQGALVAGPLGAIIGGVLAGMGASKMQKIAQTHHKLFEVSNVRNLVLEHNATSGFLTGLKIKCLFFVKDLNDVELLAIAYVDYNNNGGNVESSMYEYGSNINHLSVAKSLTPSDNDWVGQTELFIPYNAFPMYPKSSNMSLSFRIYNCSTKSFINCSSSVDFNFNR